MPQETVERLQARIDQLEQKVSRLEKEIEQLTTPPVMLLKPPRVEYTVPMNGNHNARFYRRRIVTNHRIQRG